MATPPRANLSREEPDAGNLHVRVCEGWGWQHPHLLGNEVDPDAVSRRSSGTLRAIGSLEPADFISSIILHDVQATASPCSPTF